MACSQPSRTADRQRSAADKARRAAQAGALRRDKQVQARESAEEVRLRMERKFLAAEERSVGGGASAWCELVCTCRATPLCVALQPAGCPPAGLATYLVLPGVQGSAAAAAAEAAEAMPAACQQHRGGHLLCLGHATDSRWSSITLLFCCLGYYHSAAALAAALLSLTPGT